MDQLKLRRERVVYKFQETNLIGANSRQTREQFFPSNSPQPIESIVKGICMNCANLGRCIWQHNNNTNCQHHQ